MATIPAAMSAIIIGTVNGLIRFGPRSMRAVWLFSISSMPPMPELTITPTSSGSISPGSRPDCARACLDAASANWQYRPMWRAVLRSICPSPWDPFTSPPALGVGGVEMRYPADPRDPFDHVRPDGFDVIADGGDEAHAGHRHTSTVGVGFDVHVTEDTDSASEVASSPRVKRGPEVWTWCPVQVQMSLRRSRASCSRRRLAGVSRSGPRSSRSLSRRYRTVCRGGLGAAGAA